MTDYVDPLHDERPNQLAWSRANIAEAAPGVMTPLGWTWWREQARATGPETFYRLGLLSRAERDAPIAGIEDESIAIFYGRSSTNIDHLRRLFDRLPGTDGEAFERSVMGTVRPGVQSHPTRRRYPAFFIKAPLALRGIKRKAEAAREDAHLFWRASTAHPGDSAAESSRLLAEAHRRWMEYGNLHGVIMWIGSALFGAVTSICEKAGHPGLELQIAGHGETPIEVDMVSDMWRAARGTMTVEQVVARHGFHGPDEGEVSARSWREDSAPLIDVINRYRDRGEEPTRDAKRQRAEAESFVTGSLSAPQALGARLVMRMADRFVPMREITKACITMCLDVGRAAARSLGEHLAAGGQLADPDDVFYLTLAEATAAGFVVDADVIAERKARRQEYLKLEVPMTFIGVPEPISVVEPASGGGELAGVGVSAGVYEGIARVISDPGTDDLEPGEVLVCNTTDPGWVPLFDIAGAVVVDIGGPLSHAAIVARAMGTPCVVNTLTGTQVIRDGARVCVDGGSGEVKILGS